MALPAVRDSIMQIKPYRPGQVCGRRSRAHYQAVVE